MSKIADTRDVNDPSGGHVYVALDLPKDLRPNIEAALQERKAGMRDLCDCVCQSLSASDIGMSFRRGEHAAWLDTYPITTITEDFRPMKKFKQLTKTLSKKVTSGIANATALAKNITSHLPDTLRPAIPVTAPPPINTPAVRIPKTRTVGGGVDRSSWDGLAVRDEREWSTVIPPSGGGALCRCFVGVPVGAPNGGACGKYPDFLARYEPAVPCDRQGHCGGVQVRCREQSYCKDDGRCSRSYPRGDSGALRAFDSTDNLGYRPRECGGDVGRCPVDTPYCLDDGTCWKDMRKGDTGINRTMDDIFSRRLI
jgi:hypothetical protein